MKRKKEHQDGRDMSQSPSYLLNTVVPPIWAKVVDRFSKSQVLINY